MIVGSEPVVPSEALALHQPFNCNTHKEKKGASREGLYIVQTSSSTCIADISCSRFVKCLLIFRNVLKQLCT